MPRKSYSRREFISSAAIGVAAAGIARAGVLPHSERRTSIVIISIDGIGPGDIGASGGPPTPSLDELAKSGARLSDYHSASPLPDVSFAALLSSVEPARLEPAALMASRHRSPHWRPRDADLIPRSFARVGYEVKVLAPSNCTGGPQGASAWFAPEPTDAPPTEIADRNRDVTRRALAFVSRTRTSPVFLVARYVLAASARDTGRTRAMQRFDADLAPLLNATRAAPRATLIVVAGNSGAASTFDALRGCGGVLREPAHHSLALLCGPGIPRGRVHAALAGAADIMATCAAAAGIGVANGGLDLTAQFHGDATARNTLCWSCHGSRAIRRGRWKYIENRSGDWKGDYLFDIERDPLESTNLLAADSRVVEELRYRLARHLGERTVSYQRAVSAARGNA